MMINENVIREIIGEILSVAKPERVILFGSSATGSMTSDSDVDLLVIEKNVDNPREEMVKISKALGEIGIPVDVIVMRSERFEETRNIIGGIAYPANKYGKVIYEAA
jgi:predicted nucleotidyltransferase